jgi:hypothetical protein
MAATNRSVSFIVASQIVYPIRKIRRLPTQPAQPAEPAFSLTNRPYYRGRSLLVCFVPGF